MQVPVHLRIAYRINERNGFFCRGSTTQSIHCICVAERTIVWWKTAITISARLIRVLDFRPFHFEIHGILFWTTIELSMHGKCHKPIQTKSFAVKRLFRHQKKKQWSVFISLVAFNKTRLPIQTNCQGPGMKKSTVNITPMCYLPYMVYVWESLCLFQ